MVNSIICHLLNQTYQNVVLSSNYTVVEMYVIRSAWKHRFLVVYTYSKRQH